MCVYVFVFVSECLCMCVHVIVCVCGCVCVCVCVGVGGSIGAGQQNSCGLNGFPCQRVCGMQTPLHMRFSKDSAMTQKESSQGMLKACLGQAKLSFCPCLFVFVFMSLVILFSFFVAIFVC